MSIDSFGGRKFLLTLIVIAVGSAVQILSPHGVTEAFAALLIGATATFGAANAFITTKGPAVSGEPAAAPPEPTDLTPLVHAITDLDARVNEMQVGASVHSESLETLTKGVELAQKLSRAAMELRK